MDVAHNDMPPAAEDFAVGDRGCRSPADDGRPEAMTPRKPSEKLSHGASSLLLNITGERVFRETHYAFSDRDFALMNHVEQGEVVEGWVLKVRRNAAGAEKVVAYNLNRLVTWSALFIVFARGTIFTMDRTILKYVLRHLAVAGLVIIIEGLALGFDREKILSVDATPMTRAVRYIDSFVPLCLTLYVSTTMARWWALRTRALEEVFGAFCNIVLLLEVELPGKQWEAVRTQMMKYGMAGIEMLIIAAQAGDGGDDTEGDDTEGALSADQMPQSINELVNRGMLSLADLSVLRKQSLWQRPVTLWTWILGFLVRAFNQNGTPAPRTNQFVAQCLLARDGLGTIHSYVGTQLPFAYVHLITLFVNLYNLVRALKAGFTILGRGAEREYLGVAMEMVSLLCGITLYRGLLGISYMILDPFGDDILDFPIKHYITYVAASCDACAVAQDRFPALERGIVLPKEPEPVKEPTHGLQGSLEELSAKLGQLEESVRHIEVQHVESILMTAAWGEGDEVPLLPPHPRGLVNLDSVHSSCCGRPERRHESCLPPPPGDW